MANQYSSVAVETALTGAVNAVATVLPVGATTGFPASTPYTLVLDAGTASEELVSVTGVAGLNLTVTRGYDGTSATTHQAGAAVVHCHSAKDFKDSRDHEASTAAHGATGANVGTTNTQTLTNKTIALGSNTVSGTTAQFNTALSDGDFATLAGSETLTNKTLTAPKLSPDNGGEFTNLAGRRILGVDGTAGASGNNLHLTAPGSGITPAIMAAGTDTDVSIDIVPKGAGVVLADGVQVADLSSAQTLSNKTLAAPVVTGVGEERYINKSASESVTSSTTLQDDDALTFTVAANSTYLVRLGVFYDGSAVSGGIKLALTLPAGAIFSVTTSSATYAASSGTVFLDDPTTDGVGVVSGGSFDLLVTTVGTAGSATLQWAQSASDATATRLLPGSYFRVRRVA